MERKNGLSRSLGDRYAAIAAGELNIKEMENGEAAQLLDRPWWQRVWVVQEIVLAKRAVVVCGSLGLYQDSYEIRRHIWTSKPFK